jgi:DNA-binding PadR family transcriptional regulator
LIPVDITANAIEYGSSKVLQASFRDISEHKRTADTLERMVRERTAQLSTKNKQLAEEVNERKRTEAALKKKTKQAELHSSKLQELNVALKFLLKQREDDKKELEELARHGYRLSPGTLYPTLHRLEGEGYLSVERKVVEGKVRKYYSATKQGRAVLSASKDKIAEFNEDIIRHLKLNKASALEVIP